MPRPRRAPSPGLLSLICPPDPVGNVAFLANVGSVWIMVDDASTTETLGKQIIAEGSDFAYFGFTSKEAAEAFGIKTGVPASFRPVEFRRVVEGP